MKAIYNRECGFGILAQVKDVDWKIRQTYQAEMTDGENNRVALALRI